MSQSCRLKLNRQVGGSEHEGRSYYHRLVYRMYVGHVFYGGISMKLDERKKRLAHAEAGLDNAMRRLTLATTVVRRWRSRVRTQQTALQREMEQRIAVPLESAHTRRFRDE